ncbi:MAG: hypothetical protein HRT98_02515 [Mycoplasmatales bacterium]|nr:hypothetical protein [Mycoplasmatales bacterium]
MVAIKKLIFVKQYKYNKNIFLKFDLPANETLKTFKNDFPNSDKFKHLDLSKMYSGFIRAKLNSSKCKDESKCKIYKLLTNIIKQNSEFTIQEGHRIKNVGSEWKLQEWSETIEEAKEENSRFSFPSKLLGKLFKIKKVINWKMIKVGHGLSIISNRKIIFDAGGNSKYYKEWVTYIKSMGNNLIFIISHAHRDHYNFLERFIKEGNGSKIKMICINNKSSFNRASSQCIFDLLKTKGAPLKTNVVFENIEIISEFKKTSTENENSLILIENNKIFFGDQTYENIKEINKRKAFIKPKKIVQVTHHGSLKNVVLSDIPKEFKKKEGYISSSARYGLPTSGIGKYYKTTIKTKGSKTKYITIK